jgi:hypothetical protein
VSTAYGIGIDVIDYVGGYSKMITILLNEIFIEESIDWFEWYCFENDFGRGNLEARNGDTPICRHVKELFELMILKTK